MIEGNDALAELDEGGTLTSSERQTPKAGMTEVEALQFAVTHDPARSTELESEHARQLLGPELEQLEQLESHD